MATITDRQVGMLGEIETHIPVWGPGRNLGASMQAGDSGAARTNAIMFAVDYFVIFATARGAPGAAGPAYMVATTGDLMLTEVFFQRAAIGGVIVAGAHCHIQFANQGHPQPANQQPIENHHQLPREFEARFRARGLNIEDYVIELPRDAHRLRPDGLHTGSGADNWNGAWRQFFANNPNATQAEILAELARLRARFGLG